MSSSAKASASETIRALETVSAGARSFVEREAGIDRARQLKASNLRQDLAEQKVLIEREIEAEIVQAREKAAAVISRAEKVSEQRRIRIDKAQIVVRNEVISRIQQREGARRFQLQREFMEAGRERDVALAAAAEEHAARSEETTSIQSRLIKLEKVAVKSLRGFRSLQRSLVEDLKSVETGGGDQVDSAALREESTRLGRAVRRWKTNPVAGLYNGFPLALQILLLLVLGGVTPLASKALGGPALDPVFCLVVAGGIAVVSVVGFFATFGQARKFLASIDEGLVAAKRQRLALKEQVESEFARRNESITASFEKRKRDFESGLKPAEQSGGEPGASKYSGPEEVEARAARLKARIGEQLAARRASIEQGLAATVEELESTRDRRIAEVGGDRTATGEEIEAELRRQFAAVVDQWKSGILTAHSQLVEESEIATVDQWYSQLPSAWSAPKEFLETLRFGTLHYDGAQQELPEANSPDLRFPSPPSYHLPLRLRIPDQASLLVETKHSGREEAIAFLNYLALGWLANSPPGRLSFSFIDPVGLGESFAGLMHLSDYEELLINSRIRTQPDQIDNRLGELCDHMEKVIQMYLRNDYETITQYNEAAGTIAERYHFLVVADFPHGFTEQAARRLLSIAASGARCGVFFLLHHDQRADLPAGFRMDDLRKAALVVRSNLDGFFLKDNPVAGTTLELDSPPPPDLFAQWVHRIGEENRDSNRIEVPFSFITPPDGQWWTRETSKEITVPIGRSGATKLQQLALGKGTCQHALIAGKTGSGKSTLFHVIVSNLALWCSPEEIEFYLIDFKKGVEFKCYADAQLPHARVVAIESDREFGLSVLQRLDEELKKRGELFRASGVQDVAGYRATPNAKPLPRTLLLIDEFQEFFTIDDQISQQAAVLLDRIVRQGRAFGIHAVLGSQTLGGAFTLARATLGQMTVRIALACNEADAYLIMDDSNPAPRLLTRPGEGIYNDRAGAVEANSPFQVVWLDEKERDGYLAEVRKKAETAGMAGGSLVVFEGNAPGDATKDTELRRFLGQVEFSGPPRIFLGAPNAIKGPTEIRFERQSGANLLLVGQRDDAVDVMVTVALRMLRKQFGDKTKLVLIDSRFSQPDDGSWFVEAVRAVGGVVTPNAHDLGDAVNELAAAMNRVAEGEESASPAPTFLFVPSLHRFKKLRYEDDFSFSLEAETEAKPASSLQELIAEGPGWGYHVVVSLDSYNNVQRVLGRKAAGEFEKKVLFQMSAADSASLIDSGSASDLGLARALAYDEPTGTAEIFRPYAPPPVEWFRE